MLNSLSTRYLEQHPEDAARDIERRNTDEVITLLKSVAIETRANIVVNMTPTYCTDILQNMEQPDLVSVFESIPANIASAMIRRLPADIRSSLLAFAEKDDRLESASLLVKFPASMIGSIMNPQILILHKSMNIDEVKNLLRNHEQKLANEFYVVDESHVLCGYVAARDMLVSDNLTHLTEILKPNSISLTSRSHIESIVDSRVWLNRTNLPVVDSSGVLLGDLDKHDLETAYAELDRHGTNGEPSRDILVGLAETLLNSFSEIMSSDKQSRYKKK